MSHGSRLFLLGHEGVSLCSSCGSASAGFANASAAVQANEGASLCFACGSG